MLVVKEHSRKQSPLTKQERHGIVGQKRFQFGEKQPTVSKIKESILVDPIEAHMVGNIDIFVNKKQI